jgi:hypothetical protein
MKLMPGCRLSVECADLLQKAKKITKLGFKPLFWMIDKAASEKKAIEQGMSTNMWHSIYTLTSCSCPEFPGAVIRICQFHVTQAIGRADFDAGDIDPRNHSQKKKKDKKKQCVAVSMRARSAFTNAFRRIQRFCGDEDPEPWSIHKERFDEEISVACEEHEVTEIYSQVIHYFEKYWFSSFWRGR